MSATVLDALAVGAWQVGLLTLAAAALARCLGGRLGPRFVLGLWLIVVARLCLPVLPVAPAETPRGFTLATRLLTPPWRDDAKVDSSNHARGPLAQGIDPISAPDPTPALELSAGPDVSSPPRLETRDRSAATASVSEAQPKSSASVADLGGVARTVGASQIDARTANRADTWRRALFAFWLTGVALCVARGVRAELRLRRALRGATAPNGAVVANLEVASRLAGLRRAPRVLETDAVAFPAVHGCVRPRVLLPAAATTLPTAELLAVLCEFGGEGALGYQLERLAGGSPAVRIAHPDELRQELEMRLYKVQPLLDLGRVAGEPRERDDEVVALQELADLVMQFALDDDSSWELEGRSIQPWERFLSVRQTPEAHTRIHSFLERLVQRQRAPTPPSASWFTAVNQMLAAPVTAGFDSTLLSDVLRQLSAVSGIAVLDPHVDVEFYDQFQPTTARFEGVPLREILTAVMPRGEFFWSTVGGGLWIDTDARHLCEVHIHSVEQLLAIAPVERREDLLESTMNLIYSTVDPGSWDSLEEAGYSEYRGLVVVRQTPENQAQIGAVLAQLTRALSR